MRTRLLLTAAATLALAACGGNNEADTATDAGATSTATDQALVDPAATGDAAAPTDAQGFVDMASSSDMYEIEAGKLAQQMGKDQKVKDFGAMMVADHTKSSAELKAAAAKADGVTVNPKLSAKHQANLDALKNAGDNFDATYKQQQVAAHQEALTMLQGFASGGDNEALKAFASKTAPVVEGHLQQARTLP